jgi:hypothetical protein
MWRSGNGRAGDTGKGGPPKPEGRCQTVTLDCARLAKTRLGCAQSAVSRDRENPSARKWSPAICVVVVRVDPAPVRSPAAPRRCPAGPRNSSRAANPGRWVSAPGIPVSNCSTRLGPSTAHPLPGRRRGRCARRRVRTTDRRVRRRSPERSARSPGNPRKGRRRMDHPRWDPLWAAGFHRGSAPGRRTPRWRHQRRRYPRCLNRVVSGHHMR